MNFTREPIIETIISPKEGYKIVIKNSKIPSAEEYTVDAVEIVTFGTAQFYRSLEKTKCFLLPVSDYEVMEVREARMVLKNASFEKNIKIGGGREHLRSAKEVLSEEIEEEEEGAENISEGAAPPPSDNRQDRKRDRRRNRRKRMQEARAEVTEKVEKELGLPAEEIELETEKMTAEAVDLPREPKPVITPFTGLIPPPPTLISETMARYRDRGFDVERTKPEEHASSGEAHLSHAAVHKETPEAPEDLEGDEREATEE